MFAGDRVFEFDAKARGASYLDIHSKGGGIYFTVSETQKASESQLLELFVSRLKDMSLCGTTLLECKTGYGLDLETEIKMIEVIQKAKQKSPIDLVTTFLGAHAVPKLVVIHKLFFIILFKQRNDCRRRGRISDRSDETIEKQSLV